MEKIKILEIAAEAGQSNAVLLEKAKELGFNVKVANSTLSIEQAEILVQYAIDGTLPKGFELPEKKSKISTSKKIKAIKKEVPKEETKPKEAQEGTSETQSSDDENSLQESTSKKAAPKKSLSRGGITIVRKAKPEPIKKEESKKTEVPKPPSKTTSQESQANQIKKKKLKKSVTPKESGTKLEFISEGSFGSDIELYEEEVVLLDFS
ncbi:MAG: translation initiation factor IF-2 N-terminal domain-containing protein, partial [Campylobacterales bacterium]|nr:translation initiation factor IF-2 N-terminal domain-containing protein [Campylobacterales bacterium]